MRRIFRISAPLIFAGLLVPQAASAEMTDPAAYQEAIGCAAAMTVASAAMGGTKDKPASPEMQKGSDDAKQLATMWLVRADGLNPGQTDATIAEFKTESERQTKAMLDAKTDEEFNANFRDRFRACLKRGNELKF